MIRSELIARLHEENPHLTHADVSRATRVRCLYCQILWTTGRAQSAHRWTCRRPCNAACLLQTRQTAFWSDEWARAS